MKLRAKITWVFWGTCLLSACDPAAGLNNADFAPYLDQYQKRDVSAAVDAFNGFDAKRQSFDCSEELEAAERARWREQVGASDPSKTPEMEAFQGCLRGFFQGSGVQQGLIQSKVLPQWVNHLFLPEITERIDGEVAAAQKRLSSAGCSGEVCPTLAVMGDLAFRRLGLRAAPWSRDLCVGSDLTGLRPWRLPTKAELARLQKSNKIAIDPGLSAFWASERQFDEKGRVLAWTVDLHLSPEKAGKQEAVPLRRKGLPTRYKVQCVHDLAGATKVAEGEVESQEQALAKAGCPTAEWHDNIRIKEGLLITWNKIGQSGKRLKAACAELDWCGASWRLPSREEASKLNADPWFADDVDGRCVATPSGEPSS